MMTKKYIPLITVFSILAAFMTLTGCEEYGKVDQGRVITYDKASKTLTMIRDASLDTLNPQYTHLPPVTYKMPVDPNEMGPEPKAGKRMKLDIDKKEVIYYASATNDFQTIPYTLIEQKDNVKKEDPLVYDATAKKGKTFPVIDMEKKTITIYSKRQKVLVTFTVADEYFALPQDTWDSGDEARIYYKEEGQARRFMNVSKTDIFKK